MDSGKVAAQGGTGVAGTPGNNAGPNAASPRRSSQSSTKFSGLVNQKRNSIDATAAARRQSFADQKPATGIIGQMWTNFTQGK